MLGVNLNLHLLSFRIYLKDVVARTETIFLSFWCLNQSCFSLERNDLTLSVNHFKG